MQPIAESNSGTGAEGFGPGARGTIGWRALLAATLIFLGVLAVYLKSPVTTSYDSRWTLYSAASYVAGDGGSLARYQAEIDKADNYGVEIIDGEPRSLFPEGVVFIAIPFVWVARLVVPHFDQKLSPAWAADVEKIIASGCCALACVFMFAAVYRRLGGLGVAVGAALVLAFSTPLWSTASRAMWQHGPVVLCYSAVLWILVEARWRPGWVVVLGVPLALAVVCRPTAAPVVLVLGVVVAVVHTRLFPVFAAVVVAVVAAWVAHNLAIYHAPLPAYYQPSRIAGSGTFWEAMAGNLVSPGRGLFIYSPVLLAALAAPFFARRGSADLAFIAGCLTLSLLHLVIVSRFPHWWGGHSFGPRMMSDVSPLLVFAASFPAAALVRGRGAPQAVGLAALGVLAAAGAAIHAQGAFRYAVHDWNAAPQDVDAHPERLWDWRDVAFLRPGR